MSEFDDETPTPELLALQPHSADPADHDLFDLALQATRDLPADDTLRLLRRAAQELEARIVREGRATRSLISSFDLCNTALLAASSVVAETSAE